MKHLILIAAMIALSQPLAALAGESPTPAVTKDAATQITIVSKPAATHDPLDGFVMPKYLTIQQENDARQRAFEATFAVYHTP